MFQFLAGNRQRGQEDQKEQSDDGMFVLHGEGLD